ncbi:MAG: hybrid sensor histidine kinase/response regulator [Magnetococcus sp. DMHC-6]
MIENIKKSVILIVDDERFNINILKEILQPQYDILVAMSGKQALQRAMGDFPPDLILLDILMSDLDGYVVLERLKADRNTREIPVIFVTAMGEMTQETKGFALGAVDYIHKPISPPILLARVKTHLAIKTMVDQQKESNQKLFLMNSELRKNKEDLLNLNQLKNIFLGMAAHDLRNPLVSIRGLSELLLEEDLDRETQRDFCTTIHQVSRQMLELLNQLLDVSVIESGKFQLQLAEHDLFALLQERTALLQPIAQAKNTRLNLIKEEPTLSTFCFDRDRLIQVIDNLLTNAIKFSPPGSEVIILSFYEENQFVCFSVTDQGPGISSQDRELLFKPFQKLTATPTAGEKSTGMGLFIVKKIIDAHNGHILVECLDKGGTCFKVQLPFNKS